MNFAWRRTLVAVSICAWMVLSGLPVGADIGPDDEGPRVGITAEDQMFTGDPYDHLLRFNDLEFDPVEGVLLPPGLRGVDDGHYILQFDGPIDRAWKDGLVELGVRFHWYIPNFAFITVIPDEAMDQVEGHSHVRAIQPYHTAYKIPKALWYTSFGPEERDMVAVPLHDEAALVTEIEARGGRVHDHSANEVLFTIRGDMFLEIARLPMTGWLQLFSEPEVLNDNYGRTIKVRQQADGAFSTDGESMWSYNSGNFPGLNAGEYVIVAVFDTGMDTTHPAYENTPGDPPKLVWFKDYNDGSENDWHDTGSHGTHTSCTVLGNGKSRASDPGTAGRYSGMAPRARLIGQAGLTVGAGSVYKHLNDPYTHGANLTSNSWGDPSSHKRYTALSRNYDIYTRDANTTKNGDQELLSVFAAGNEGNAGPREPAVAKNVLTVGATGNDKGSSSNSVVGFSAKGPTDDGRTKPDIVTPGDGVVSCSTGSTSYRSASGTSMACPGAAGGVAVVMSHYNQTFGSTPSPALTKAIIINGASPLPGYGYPGNSQGWGRMNIANSLLENDTKKIYFQEQSPSLSLETGFSVRIDMEVKSQGPIRATLVWTDVAGASDNPKPALVNDLNLKVITPTEQSYWGNSFSGGQSSTGGSADTINNVEGIYIPTPATGDWSVRVEGFNIADGPQDYALVISGDISMGIPVLEAEDLIPTNLTFIPDEDIIEGDVVTITADINNNGTRLTSSIRYQWWINNELADILNFDGEVLPKGKVSIEYEWLAKRGNHEFRLVLDPYNTHFEQNESNNWIIGNLWVDNFGLEFNAKNGSNLKADPGGSTTYVLQIKNPGTVNDTYHIEFDDPPVNWSVEIETDTIEVGSDQVGEVEFSVFTPAKALTTEFARIQVRVTSEGNDTYHGHINTVTSINQIAAINMTIDTNTSTIIPKGKAKYIFWLHNEGNGMDTVTLTVNGTPFGWFIGLSDYVAVLDPYSSKDFSAVVTAPFNAEAGFEANVRLEGFSTSGVYGYVEIATTVDRVWGMNLTSEAEPAKVHPGETLDFGFTLHNKGNGPEGFDLMVEYPEGWDSNMTTEVLDTEAFAIVDRVLTLTVPEDGLMGDFIIRLTAENSSGASMELDFKVSVLQVFGLEAYITPSYVNVTKGHEAMYNLTVTNLGNGPDDIEFWLDSTNLLLYSRFSNSSLTLGPGETVTVTLLINTSMLAPGNFTIPVFVYSLLDPETTADLGSLMEVVEPPPEKPKDPDKPDPPGPIDITPGGDLRSSQGLMVIFFIILILLIVGMATIAAYNKYRTLRDKQRDDEQMDRIVDDEEPEKPPLLVKDIYSYDEPKSSFRWDEHMAAFGSTKEKGTEASDEETVTVEEEEVEEEDEDEGLLPPTVVDDTVSSSMTEVEEETEEEQVEEASESTEEMEEDQEEQEEGAEEDERTDSEKEMEEAERSLDDIMKDLDI